MKDMRCYAVPVLVTLWVVAHNGLCAQAVSIPERDSSAVRHLAFLEPAPQLHRGRFWGLTSAYLGGYAAVSAGLYELWYAGYPQGRFRIFNDFGGWYDYDKVGHMYTAYFETSWVFDTYRWAGVKRKQALLMGAAASTVAQSTIEIMDGFSEGWGFSPGDVLFNTLGTGLYVGQELLWQEQRITLKFSYTPTLYPDVPVLQTNPDAPAMTYRQRAAYLYGSNYVQGLVKDYNGHTQWASVNIASFLPPNGSSRWPKWLNVAVGYGVNNLYGADRNSWQWNPTDAADTYFSDPMVAGTRTPQWYLSLDVDLRRIPVRSRLLKFLLAGLNMFKVPAPALEFNTRGERPLVFRPLYW